MGKADVNRTGPLRVPHLRALGLGNAIELSANQNAPGIDPISGGTGRGT